MESRFREEVIQIVLNWMDGWMDEWKDGWMEVPMCFFASKIDRHTPIAPPTTEGNS